MMAAALLIAAASLPDAPARVQVVAAGKGFAGVVLLAEGGKVTLEQGFGGFKAGDSWRWASVTKQVAATIAMQDVAAGRLDLDAPITRYLPAFQGPTGPRITVAMLLGHTSGLPDSNANNGALFRPGATQSSDELCAGPPRDQPGASFYYDNCDYIVAGRLLEAINGKSFASLLAERIAGPLRMTSVQLAGVNVGGLEGGKPESPQNLAAYGPAGAITGTVRDMWRFDQALIDGTLMPAAQRARMWEARPQYGYAAFSQWVFDAPLQRCAAPQRLVERRGNIGGVQVRNFILPDRNIVLIAITNRDDTDFGEIWQGKGLAHDLLSAAACKDET